MMRHITKSLLLSLATLPIVVGAFELTPQQMANVKVTTTTVTERQSAATLFVNGTVRADQQRLFRVAPVVDGLVTDLKVVEYNSVRKGQVLARLHSNTLGQAQADYLEALARHEVAQTEYQRIKGLYQDGVVAESRRQEAESQYKTAQAVLDQRRRALALAGVTGSQVDALTQHPDEIADYSLFSPTNGVLLEVAVESGQMLAAGETAFRIADLSEVVAEVRIPVAIIGQVAAGDKVNVKVSAFPQQSFPGRLHTISGEVEPNSQTLFGRVAVDNRQGRLRPGMYMQAELPGIKTTGLMAPESAIFRSGNDTYLFKVVGPRSYEPVKVTVSPAGGGWIKIESGVAAGSEIVSGGVAELKSHWQYQGSK